MYDDDEEVEEDVSQSRVAPKGSKGLRYLTSHLHAAESNIENQSIRVHDMSLNRLSKLHKVFIHMGTKKY